MQSPNNLICNGKPRGIFINTQKANCSIYESGAMVYQCLKLSDKYSLDYMEIDPRNPKLDKCDFYFFNYHHETMKFIDTKTLRQLPGLTLTTILETLPNNPFPLCPPGDFDIYCALDPTMNIPDRRVYAFPRPLEAVEHITPYKETQIPVIGSFGFATPGKGFELVVDAVNREFDEAIVKINIPASTYADDVTFRLFKRKYSDYLSDLCKRVAKPGIKVVITNDFMNKNELIEWCGQNTLNCFFYDRNQPGLAATTDQAITSERPLLVSANDTFRHIHQYIKPYPYQTLKEAIKSSGPAVLKMKNDWHPQKFAEKFEIVLEDCNLLPRTKRENEINIITSKGKKDTVLIVSHKKAQCGIYQYGVDIASALQKSKEYDFVYAECSSQAELNAAITTCSPKVIIYNYYHFTMPWLNRDITKGYRIPQFAVMHEVTQEEADNATQEMFDGFLCPDPTLKENNPYVFKTARLIPTFCNCQHMPDVPTIGSFGFGFCNKGFERLIDIAQKEFDRVRIRLHMPFNSIVDDKGAVHALDTAQRCRKTITNKNVELQINHSYLSKEELLKFLASNTINAFLYDANRYKGVSSVIDSALAVRRPIAVTKSGMFRHVLNATPSICIEDSDFKTIIRNGIVPLIPFYNDWSEAAFIKRYEDVLNKILSKAGNNECKTDKTPQHKEVECSTNVVNRNKIGAISSSIASKDSESPYEEKAAAICVKEQVMNNVTDLIQEAEKLIRAKSFLTARIILNEIMRHDSHNIVGLIDLSVCDILEGKNDDAVKKLNIVLSVDPDNKVAKDNLQYIFQQGQNCKNEKRFNKILDNIAREEYKETINTMFAELPDMMARKIPEANVQQAFVYDTVMKYYRNYSAPRILCVGSYEDTAAALLKKKGIVIEEIDPAINCDLNTFTNHPNTLKGSYDIIFSTSVIEHVQDDALFIRQIEQLLAPNGVGVITCDYNDNYQPGDKVPQEDYRFYTQKDLRERLMGYISSCSLVDMPDWDCPNPDFVYGGCRYAFATLVFQKKKEKFEMLNRKEALTIDPNCLKAYLQIADEFVRTGKYKEVATIYKQVIGFQPTLSTVYNLGLHLAKEGNLNDEFYQSILNVVETPEIISMIKYLAKSPEIYQPSKLWLYFMIFNTFQLETGKIVNFKRTVNHNYFNWTADVDVNNQFQALRKELNWSDDDLVNAEKSVYFDSAAKPKEFTEKKWQRYVQFLCLLWEFTSKKDRLMLLNHLEEPMLGNPVVVEYKGRKVAQDICNSVMEVNTIMEFTNHNPQERMRVIELGAGHGRVANVLLHAVANVQVVIVDIPPALYVSQWYLSNLFPKHKVFKFRDFSNYREVQHEFEGSSIAFLSPAQVEYLPDQMFDLFINISSLHEMTYAQIEMWFGHIDRICNKWFYTKQYIENKNIFDNIVIRQKDYPVRAHWQELLNRRSPIYPELFEAIYRVH